MLKDEEYLPSNGYNGLALGDSGGPIWRKTYRYGIKTYDYGKKGFNSEEYRHTVVAVTSHSVGFHKILNTNIRGQHQCNIKATKLTVDIIKWIKKLDKDTQSERVETQV